MKSIVISIVSIACLTGCQPKIEECWSPDSKLNTSSLVKKLVVELLEKEINRNNFKEEKLTVAKDAVTIKIDTYHAIARNTDGGSLSCGATVAVTVKDKNGKVFTANDLNITYEIYKAELGYVYSIARLPFANLVSDLK